MPTAEGWRPYVAPFRAAGERLGPGGRRVAILAGLALLLGGAAWLGLGRVVGREPAGTVWLYEGRVFEASEASALLAALRGARVPCVESGGRVGVPADRRMEALEALSRAKLGPRPIDELLEATAGGGSFWESPEERAGRQRLARARVAGEIIGRLRGVTSATVTLTPVPAGTRLQPATRLKAMALVETEGGQVLPRATVEMIRHVLTSIDDVDPEAITLFNPAAGHEYLVAGRPEVAVLSNVRGREEELRTRLLDQLRIDGVAVSVRIDPPLAAEPPPAPRAVAEENATRANRPIDLGAEPEPEPEAAPEPPARGRATVLVRVPRSHYLRLYREIEPERPASPEALGPIVERVRHTVQTVVHAVIPAEELGRLVIDRLDDPEPPAAVPPPRDVRRVAVREWLPTAAVAALAAVVVAALAGGWLATRRSESAAPSSARGPHRRGATGAAEAEPSGPGPVERLVRRDPEAAAGVLRRWIHQGGHER
jgi:hypothetical protein